MIGFSQMQKVERLKSMCLQYAAATQWLISSSIELHNPEGEEIQRREDQDSETTSKD